ncbi:MAG: hypothetical protein AAF517_25185 [Planctomycetota bacterium]
METILRTSACWLIGVVLAFGITPTRAQEAPKKNETGKLKGTVSVAVSGVSVSDLGPVVAFLDAVDGSTVKFEVPKELPTMSQKNAKFSPSFLVVVAGQTVRLPNDDKIVHNVFSYSKPNDFDLGLYPKGKEKRVRMVHPGVVDVYCSIHAKMNAVILVSPSPYFCEVESSGSFRLEGVPPGKYRLTVWNKKLPETSKIVEVTAGKETVEDVTLSMKKGKKKKKRKTQRKQS